MTYVIEVPELMALWSPNNTLDPGKVTTGSDRKALWVCSKGHEWDSRVNTTKYGARCPYCVNQRVLVGYNDLRTTHPELSSEISPNSSISATDVTYGTNKKILWVCPIGHEWRASVASRSRGHGCPYCSGRFAIPNITDLATTHTELATQIVDKDVHNPAKLKAGSHDKVLWRCEDGHEWYASVPSRTRGRGCPVCAREHALYLRMAIPGVSDIQTTHPDIAKEVHPDSEWSSQQVSAGSDRKVLWVCRKEHTWLSTTANRINLGNGCPKCSGRVSRVETELYGVITEHFPDSVQSYKIPNTHGKELDIFIPSLNVGIEFNGLYWHSEANSVDKNKHKDKLDLCNDRGIRLIVVWEDDYRDNKEVVVNGLLYKLGVSSAARIFARKTTVDFVETDEARGFLNANHIQGFVSSTSYTGLRTSDGTLVALLAARKDKDGLYNLTRYATSASVVGGFTKLVRAAENRHPDITKWRTFADQTVSDGGLYTNNGFTQVGLLKPDYAYIYEGSRVHKFSFRLKRFRTDTNLEYRDGLTEKQLAELNGIPRIWDYGKIIFEKTVR